jgi:hypothetical protein
MPHKKAKADKSKKPGKPAKPAAKLGMGDAMKKAAKKLVSKTVVNLAKKGAPLPKKSGKPLPAAKKPLLVKQKAELVPGKKPIKAVPAQPQKADKNGKKRGNEVVVVEVVEPKVKDLLQTKKAPGAKTKELSASAKRRCREPGCDHDGPLHHYCRLHYIKNWRKIKRKEAILASGQLNNYVEELVNKYPDKYLDVIRQDLASEKDWAKVVVDLELESSEEEAGGDEDLDAVAEGVRPTGGGRSEFEGDDDGF